MTYVGSEVSSSARNSQARSVADAQSIAPARLISTKA